jgi:DNA-binding response OmpR family regulator
MLRNKAILLVEDNQDEIDLALHAFRSSNIANKVVVKTNGKDALDYLFHSDDTLPGVVLLDLNLPKLSGIEVLREIRANDRTHLVPVVVMTTSREERDVVNSYELHANSYVVKPVDFQQFTESMRQLGVYWLLLNEGPNP